MSLSVVIIAYVRPEGLNKTLASLLQQIRQPDDLLVYANPSVQDLRSVVERLRHCFRVQICATCSNTGYKNGTESACSDV